jgi:hypothetical protein
VNDLQQRLPAILGQRLLVIADYQRPYAWEGKQLEDLWEDLDLLGPKASHYAGTLVLREVREAHGPVTSLADDGQSLAHYEVVDGQQRLTTCLLLLDRIRRRYLRLTDQVDNAAASARNLRETYGIVSVDNAPRPRLQLGAGLSDFWVRCMLGHEAPDATALLTGEQRLSSATEFFDARLEGLDSDDPQVTFQRLRDLQVRVTQGLGFLVHEVATTAEVGVIFETLNERGRPLSELEKTKNYLLYLARSIDDGRADQLSDLINTSWATVFRNLAGLGRDAEDQLLRAHWFATRDPEQRSWQQVASVKSLFERSRYVSGASRLVPRQREETQEQAWDRLNADLTRYVDDLRKCSYFLRDLEREDAGFDDFPATGRQEVRRAVAALQRSGIVAPYRPLLFAARLRHAGDADFFSRLVRACEAYSARVFVVRQYRVNAGRSRLFRLAHDLYTATDDRRDWVLDEIAGLTWRYADDDSVRKDLLAVEENWYVRRGHKYSLYEYELSLRAHDAELPPLSHFMAKQSEQRTTDYVLPQTPNPDAACWHDAFSADEQRQLRHALGNLVLTYDNSRYSNKCFAGKRGEPLAPGVEKRACYAQAELLQEQELAAISSWTPAEVADRQARLATWAVQRWHVPAPPAEVLDEDVEIDDDADDPAVAI